MFELLHSIGKGTVVYNDLFALLTETGGLTINADKEIYATTNQQTSGGDGKQYYLKPDPQGRLVKSISANFRYPGNTGTIMALFFNIFDVPAWDNRVGMYDDWNNQVGFKLVSDIHDRELTSTPWNGRLTRTFPTALAQETIGIRIGGRATYAYSPAYIKNIIIEYEEP